MYTVFLYVDLFCLDSDIYVNIYDATYVIIYVNILQA